MEDMLQYLDDFVEPTINDFEANPSSVRHAFLACVTTYHAIDYLAHPRKRPATLKQTFRRESPEFAIVDDVAHAFKHVVVGQRQSPRLKSDQIMSRPAAVFEVSATLDVSQWDDETGGVTIDTDRTVNLLEVTKAAVIFLRGQESTDRR